jgi:hypothetical protein
VIDNGSGDDTLQVVQSRLSHPVIGVESLPPAAHGKVSWQAILDRKVELARELGADWYLHHDADEIREGPWPGVNLRDAIRTVDRLGYNAIDFRLFNFPPVDDMFKPGEDPRAHFTRWEDPAEYDRVQRKCWKGGVADLSLDGGGHEVRFADQRLFPLRFVLCHYPIRGQTHGTRKVLHDRSNRFTDREIAIGWHRQYDDVGGPDHLFLKNPAQLKQFDLDRERLDTIWEDASNVPRPADEEAARATRSSADIHGALDRVAPDVIAGWAVQDHNGESVTVQLWDGAHPIADVVADQPRPDLAEREIGDGTIGGFALKTPRELLDGRPHWIWATVAGTPVPLRRSPLVLDFGHRRTLAATPGEAVSIEDA